MTNFPREIQNIADTTDFVGYVVMDYDGVFGKTTDVTNAVGWASDRSKMEGLAEYVKVFYVFTWGKYAKNPGERGIEAYDWEKARDELMYGPM